MKFFLYILWLENLKLFFLKENQQTKLVGVPLILQPDLTDILLRRVTKTAKAVVRLEKSSKQNMVVANLHLLAHFNIFYNKDAFDFYWYTCHILPHFIKKYTGFSTRWYFVDSGKTYHHDKFLTICHKFFKRQRYFFKPLTFRQFYHIFLQLTIFKNSQNLIYLIQKKYLKLPIKRHRRLFSRIHALLKSWYRMTLRLKTIKGYSLFFKGKLGKKGSVRKRTIYSKNGLVSKTNKSLRVNTRLYYIWTVTGVVGAGISIFFNIYVCTNFYVYLYIFSNFYFNFFFFFCNPYPTYYCAL